MQFFVFASDTNCQLSAGTRKLLAKSVADGVFDKRLNVSAGK